MTGCGGESLETVEVSGKVTLDGAPLSGASVVFQPIASDGKLAVGSGSFGKTDAEGRYTLSLINNSAPGAVVGEHRVIITTAQDENPASDAAPRTEERVPAQYRDGSLRFTAPGDGTDQADFVLKSS
jgi:hypothetical protein